MLQNDSIKIMIHGPVYLAVIFFCLTTMVFGNGLKDKSRKKKIELKELRHLVAYGGIQDRYLPMIAENMDFLIVGDVKPYQIKRLKRLNPKIKVIKYYHAIGAHRSNRNWQDLNDREEWFVHDQTGKNRLVAVKYGWYLLNTGQQSLRQFLIEDIRRVVTIPFDGVFLDDFWSHFINKFNLQNGDMVVEAAAMENWQQNMILFLKELREKFDKMVVINGLHEVYAPHVDGLFDEGFIHSNTQQDFQFKPVSENIRKLNKIRAVKKYGKHIFLQSGTLGSDDPQVNKVFRFCYGSFLLVYDGKVSFGFQKGPSYFFKGLVHPGDKRLDDRMIPATDFFDVSEFDMTGNMLNNGGFERGFGNWSVIKGHPTISHVSGNRSIYFKSNGQRQHIIKSDYIPVEGQTKYHLYLENKCINNQPFGQEYKKLGLRGRFFNRDFQKLPGAYDLQLDRGTYDWSPFETAFTSPKEAVYFQIRIGFIGGGSGQGWIDNIYLSKRGITRKILRREFYNHFILVDFINKSVIQDLL